MARFEITSFAFMLVCVPEPFCQTDERKVIVERPSYLVGGAAICSASAASSAPQRRWPRGRHLLQAERMDQTRGKAFLADLEDTQRALRLRTPVAVGGDLDRTERIVLDARRGHVQSSEMLVLAATAFQRATSLSVCVPSAAPVYCSGGSNWMACSAILSVKALSVITFW